VARLLVIHHNEDHLRQLAKLLEDHHEFMAIDNLLSGVKHMPKIMPDVVVVGNDKKKKQALRLLRYFRISTNHTPVVVVSSVGDDSHPMLLKLGAKVILKLPLKESELNSAIAEAMQCRAEELAGPRPITNEELRSNLTMLEKSLNEKMKCFAGKNQVFIYSQVAGSNKSKPRITLRCALRSEYGLNRDVYYEYIRDICCSDPDKCEAIQRFNAERESA